MTEDRDLLWKIHCARMTEHWGKQFDSARSPWPKTDKEWRQVAHGAPFDTNVEMARFTLRLFYRLAPMMPERSSTDGN